MAVSETVLHETRDDSERVILAGIDNEDSGMNIEDSMRELKELVETAGAVSVASVIQKRESVHPGHYLGKGKIYEIKDMIAAYDATGIVCDDELSPAQIKNLEEMLEIKVIDRTTVILDIFAGHALSREGKIQVELAQLKYRMKRLTGKGISMSRLGGGIGTRGPGEKKLETDRRHIKERISELNSELEQIKRHRGVLRTNRDRKGMPMVSLVGYTNAGKSTLLNLLTGSDVLVMDQVFATLDTTVRKLYFPGGSSALVADTVGFIQKLPHHLIQAFRATLEELKFSDLLIHVVDSSNPNRNDHMKVVYDTLSELGCGEKPIITLYNKIDRQHDLPVLPDARARDTKLVSAKTGEGIPDFLASLEEILNSAKRMVTVLIPYSEGGLISHIHNSCEIISEEHRPEGTFIEAYMTPEDEGRLERYKTL